MARYALVKGGVVATVVESGSAPVVDLGGSWVDVTASPQVGTGYVYNGSAFSEPAVKVSLTPREFWRRFTAAERELLQEKFITGTQPVRNKIGAFKDYVATGGNVELNDDYIIASVTAMESAGVLAAGRAAQILGA